jgi:hypothetical protein
MEAGRSAAGSARLRGPNTSAAYGSGGSRPVATQQAVEPKSEIRIDPWQPAAEVSEALGWSLALFGMPGCGKTTFSAISGALIIDLEGGTEVIADRKDVMVWPRRDPNTGKVPVPDWDSMERLSNRLKRGDHPFKVLCFDTVSKGQKLSLQKVMKQSPTPEQPTQPEYGRANILLGDLIESWCGLARETGINVVFNVHAEEVKDEDTGVVLIRMSVTPGLIKTVYQSVSSIGYLAEDPKTSKRRLLLRNTNKVTAKFRQPQSGPQLPLEIDNPSLENILAHREKARAARKG